MKTLTITWQRLLADAGGRTCHRCGATGRELERAVETLNGCLAHVGIEIVLVKKALDAAAFAEDALESNRIWIGGKPLEEWLGANVGRSVCCEVCGNAECRTVEIEQEAYETIPADLVVRAGLIAASGMIASPPEEGKKTKSNKRIKGSRFS